MVEEARDPEVLMHIRLVSAATGVLLAVLPRSTCWKLSLYCSTKLMVLATSMHYSFITHSLESMQSLALNSCTPFLLAFGAFELPAKITVQSGHGLGDRIGALEHRFISRLAF